MKNKDFQADFVGIGVPRAATTWIFNCLKEHPEICAASEKEIAYFRDHYEKGLDYYKKFFQHCDPNQIKGEYTPGYFFSGKDLAKRIRKHNPDVKLILCLRNPIDRLYSSYLFAKNRGSKQSLVSFEEALEKDFLNDDFYSQHLKDWLDAFPRENIFIGLFEEIEDDPEDFIRRIYDFLEVDTDFVPEVANSKMNRARSSETRFKLLTALISRIEYLFKSNSENYLVNLLNNPVTKSFYKWGKNANVEKSIMKKGKDTTKPAMRLDTRKKLQRYFSKDIKELEKLIDKDLSHWKIK